jgi:hypothetical protein
MQEAVARGMQWVTMNGVIEPSSKNRKDTLQLAQLIGDDTIRMRFRLVEMNTNGNNSHEL